VTEPDDEIRPAAPELEGRGEERAHRRDLDSLVKHRHRNARAVACSAKPWYAQPACTQVLHVVANRR
jgi:hypothetical protein